MRYLTLALLLSAANTFAAEPTTKPKDVAPKDRPTELILGQVVDECSPAFVPKFAQVNNPLAGNFAERDWARTNTYPAPFLFYWPGYYGFGYYGYGFGFTGFSAPTHSFMR